MSFRITKQEQCFLCMNYESQWQKPMWFNCKAGVFDHIDYDKLKDLQDTNKIGFYCEHKNLRR